MAEGSVDIVVADDNAVLLGVLSEILEECGHSVRTATDGLKALIEIRKKVPDVLLSDLNMPCMSGFELLAIVRRRYPNIKVIAMSASYPRGVVPQGVAADGFYEKGASKVAELLLYVNAMKLEVSSRLLRATAAIWIPRPSAESFTESRAALTCPECLKVYACAINENDSVHHRSCPYCLYYVQLAFIPANTGTDIRGSMYYDS